MRGVVLHSGVILPRFVVSDGQRHRLWSRPRPSSRSAGSHNDRFTPGPTWTQRRPATTLSLGNLFRQETAKTNKVISVPRSSGSWKMVPGGRRFSRDAGHVCYWSSSWVEVCWMDIYPQRSFLGGSTRYRWGTEEICCSSRVSPGPFSFHSVGRSVAKTPFGSGVKLDYY